MTTENPLFLPSLHAPLLTFLTEMRLIKYTKINKESLLYKTSVIHY